MEPVKVSNQRVQRCQVTSVPVKVEQFVAKSCGGFEEICLSSVKSRRLGFSVAPRIGNRHRQPPSPTPYRLHDNHRKSLIMPYCGITRHAMDRESTKEIRTVQSAFHSIAYSTAISLNGFPTAQTYVAKNLTLLPNLSYTGAFFPCNPRHEYCPFPC
jgi:hypothetical protein